MEGRGRGWRLSCSGSEVMMRRRRKTPGKRWEARYLAETLGFLPSPWRLTKACHSGPKALCLIL